MNKLKLIIFSLISMTLFACSGGGGGSRLDYKQFCPNDYNPLPLKIDGTNKLELKIENLPVGKYTLISSDFYVKDARLGKDNEVRIHARQFRNMKHEMTTTGVCSAGLKPGDVHEHGSVGISAITKDENGKFDMEISEFHFRMDPKGFKRTFEKNGDMTGEPPSKVFDGKAGATTEYALFKKKDADEWEIRTIDTFTENVVYSLSTRLKREDLPKPETTEPTTPPPTEPRDPQ